MENDKMLVDFEFTDATHKVLKKVHLNFDNLSEEAGYILKEKAIPIVWLDTYCTDSDIGLRDNDSIAIRKLIEDWKAENEQEN